MMNEMTPEKIKVINSVMPLYFRSLEFKTFSGKSKCHYEGRGAKQDFTAHIRVKRDSVIWASITALGGMVQVARILVTPDSFKMINYMDKEYTFMSVEQAKAILPAPVDFKTLQNLVMGNVLRQLGIPMNAVDAGQTIMLEMAEDQVIHQATYNKADSTLKTLQMKAVAANGANGILQYSSYQKVSGKNFSMNRTIQVTNAGEQFYMDLNFANVSLDQPVDIPFSVPKGYKKK